MKYLLLYLLLVACQVIAFSQNKGHVQGDVLIQLHPDQNIRETVARLTKLNGEETKLEIIKNISAPLRIWHLHIGNPNINETAFLRYAASLPGVAVAQLNHYIAMRETTPNDPNFGAQWQWVNTGQGGGTPDADVDADLAWDITTGGKTTAGHDIVVCVVEGANRNHPDLQGNLWFNTAEIPSNDIDDDGNGYVDDYNGWNINNDDDQIPSEQHGTQVSGMIGAKGNNGLFTTGINWDVKIMHVEFSGITESNVIESYTYPLVQRRIWNQTDGAQGAFVVATNSSWGIDGGNPADSPLWCAFYDSLGVEGILSCGATANNNVNIDQVLDLPTACTSEYMVAVTATDNEDVRTFSGYGTTHIDVGAPGGGIVTISTNGGPSTTSGTSFASPLTAGIITLLYSAPCTNISELALADPASAALLIRDALYEGVDIIPNLVDETKYGGRVNAFNSLNILIQNCGPCPKPYNVEVSNILDVSAVVSWQSPDSSLTSKLRYKLVSDITWTYIQGDGITSPFTLTDLLACNDYEVQLQEVCASDTSGYSNSIYFETEGCCVAPSDVVLSNLGNGGATITWTSVFAANSYNFKLISPQGEQLITDVTDNFMELFGLDSCTDYQVQLQTVCDTGTTDFTLPLSFTTFGCGACRDFVYCASTGQSTQYEWIENVQIGFINNTSGNDDGYGDFTDSNMTTELITYTANPISITPGYAGGTYPEWVAVYIDFNQDGDLSDAGEKVFDSGTTVTSTVTGSIVVPGTAVIGTTRMRVVMRWNTQPGGPCTTFNAGEVEDYCVSINPGSAPNCTAPVDLTLTDTTTTAATLTWTAITDANDYTVQYRKVGITGWTTVTATTPSLELTPLETCKDYEVHVRANCTGLTGDYSTSLFFKTLCGTSTSEQLFADEMALLAVPNPFADDLTLSFHLVEAQQVHIELTDVCGRMVFERTQFFPAGDNRATFTPELASGVYLVKVQVENGMALQKVIKR